VKFTRVTLFVSDGQGQTAVDNATQMRTVAVDSFACHSETIEPSTELADGTQSSNAGARAEKSNTCRHPRPVGGVRILDQSKCMYVGRLHFDFFIMITLFVR
jgi:hypothetical protein